MEFQHVRQALLLPHQAAFIAGTDQTLGEKFLREGAGITVAENQASSANHLARRDQDIHVGRDPERVVPIKRFGQGNAFQRDRGHSGLVQQPEQARQFLGEEHAPDRIGSEGVRQLRADRVRDAGKVE